MKKKDLNEIYLNVLNELEQLQNIPAPTFKEYKRAEYIYFRMKEIGFKDIEIDEAGNVLGKIEGKNPDHKPILISAHLDTVHPENVNHEIVKKKEIWTGPGIGDNTLALASLLNLGRYFISYPPEGNLIIVFNTAEEGLGNLAGIKTIVNRFKETPLFYLVLEGIGLGVIFNRGLGVFRYHIQVSTPGGHSWGNFGQPSAIHELAKLITLFNVKGTNPKFRSSFNFGKINGGVSVNSIAREADVEMEIRSEHGENLQFLQNRLYKIIEEVQTDKTRIKVKKIGERPYGELKKDHWLVQSALNNLKTIGLDPKLVIGSTDANYPLSLGYPAICLCITKGGNVHTPDEFIQLNPIRNGLIQIYELITSAWKPK